MGELNPGDLMGDAGAQDRMLVPPQTLTQPPPSGTMGSVDQRCHLWVRIALVWAG